MRDEKYRHLQNNKEICKEIMIVWIGELRQKKALGDRERSMKMNTRNRQ